MNKIIQHHIIVKWNETVTDKAKMADEVKTVFDACKEIDGVQDVEVISNVVNRVNRYDLMIRITMDLQALPLYDESECHKKWKAEYGKFIEKKAIFDSQGNPRIV